MKRNTESFLLAFLGVVIGVLLTLSVSGYIYNKKSFDGDYNRWRKLNLILQEVGKNYVDTINMEAMTDAAVIAALEELDPHSIYLPPVELSESETALAGNFDGIGIQFNVPNDTAIVLNVIQGGPSEKAGLMQGDRILKVDTTVIAGTKTPQDNMVKLMKGLAGTKVNILVSRDGHQIPFEITRGKIPVNSVDAAFMLDDHTGYLKLTKFSRTTYSEFVTAAEKLSGQGMTSLIFDVRDNTGGYFDQAISLCNAFLEKDDMIVYMEGLHRPRQEFKADGRGKYKDLELTVLINEGSASSSEIFAGAIQDNDRGRIIGRRSFGKGLVQEPINFTDGSGVRLTVARFYTPSGRCIQKPYAKDYAYDVYERYAHGEMVNADSMKVDTSVVYRTVKGRPVYGGGGIVPDVFVPVDTTKASKFFIACSKKATTMRFASAMFDKYKGRLSQIEDFAALENFMRSADIERQFLNYALSVDGLKVSPSEWNETRVYMLPQIYALVGRYSKLDEEAFYRFYLTIDDVLKVALGS